MILTTRFLRRRGMVTICMMGVAHNVPRAPPLHRRVRPVIVSRRGEENNPFTESATRFRFVRGGFLIPNLSLIFIWFSCKVGLLFIPPKENYPHRFHNPSLSYPNRL